MTGTSINDLKSFFSQTDGQLGMPQVTKKDGEDSFTSMMEKAQGNIPGALTGSQDSKGSQGVMGAGQSAQNSQTGTRVNKNENLRRDMDDRKVSDTGKTDDAEADTAGIDEKISERVDRIKKQIRDELGITDEQLLAAMEALNLTEGDLFNVDNVKNLMMELSGVDNPVDLLTNEDLLSSINTVTGLVTQSTDELKELLSADDEMFAGLLERYDQNRAEGIPLEKFEEPSEEAELDPSVLEKLSVQRPVSEDKETSSETDVTTKNVETVTANNGQETVQKVTKTQNPNETGTGSGKENENAGEQLAMPQTIVQTEVTSTGEVVQTVREYSSFAENAEIVNQVTEQIRVNISADSTSMEMMLHPASLGAVNIQVTQQGDILHAQILVQNEAVKDALAGQLEQLLKTFEEQGQKVTEVEVSVANYNLERGLDQGQGQNEQNSQSGGGGGRRLRRAFDLNALSDDELSDLDEEDRLNVEVMSMNGASVEYRV